MSEKNLDLIWLSLKLNALPDRCSECDYGCQGCSEDSVHFRHKKLEPFQTQFHFRIRRHDDNGEFIGFEGYWQIFDCLVFLSEDAEDFCCGPSKKSGTKIFQLTNDQAMDEGELITLEMKIDEMLGGKVNSCYLEFMDPIFNFTLDTQDDEPFMKMNLMRGDLDIFFNARDMRLFSLYLKLKRGKISLEDEKIRAMFERGTLYKEKFFGERLKNGLTGFL